MTGYSRSLLVDVLVYHYRKDSAGCGCGWAELGLSHAEHVVDMYEWRIKRIEANDGPRHGREAATADCLASLRNQDDAIRPARSGDQHRPVGTGSVVNTAVSNTIAAIQQGRSLLPEDESTYSTLDEFMRRSLDHQMDILFRHRARSSHIRATCMACGSIWPCEDVNQVLEVHKPHEGSKSV